MYEFNMEFVDNRNKEELILFVRNYKMTLEASEIIKTDTKNRYLCIIISDRAMRKFGTLCVQIKSTIITHLN